MSQNSSGLACCPLCGSIQTRPKSGYQHIPPGDWSLHSCGHCGTSFVHPMPDWNTLKIAYDEDYYGSLEHGKFVGPVEKLVLLFRYLRARSIRRMVSTGRILDVGCGRGLMLRFLKSWGYEVDGVELDTIAAIRAEKNLGQKVFHSLEEVARASRKPFQAICFWHALEHMPEPDNALSFANDSLASEGILVIAAPNVASIQSRLAGTHWLHLALPRHVVHFDMTRLASFLEEEGYEVLRQNHFSQEYNVIDMLCHLYRLLGFPPFFPFDLIRNKKKRPAGPFTETAKTVVGTCLFVLLTAMALLMSNFFSLIQAGSTTTLFLRK